MIVLLLLVWGPTPATKQAVTALILIGLLVLGFEMLRRQTARENPDASLADSSQRWNERISGLMGGPRGEASATRQSDHLEALERLMRLKDSGALNEEEFQRQKLLILDGEPKTTGASSR